MANWVKIGLIVIGAILILDQLRLFGIPFPSFLPNLADLDPTGREDIHHWMLGAVMVAVGICLPSNRRK